MLTVKFEQMYPTREFITVLKFDDRGLTVKQVTEKVEQYIETRIARWTEQFPTMTELRWEFEEIGQGHYLPINVNDIELPAAWVGYPDYTQLIDILKRAVEVEDYKMAEDISYYLRLRQDRPYYMKTSSIVLPYAFYKFDWMYDDVDCVVCGEQFKDLPDESNNHVCQNCSDIAEKIHNVSEDVEEQNDYRKLLNAYTENKICFESNGQEITNPFFDETLRFAVDPFTYYGRKKLSKWL